MKQQHANLFNPIKIGTLEIKNRIVMGPMGPGGLTTEDGVYNEKGVEYYVARAKGGAGLILTGVTYVENEIEKSAMPSMACPTLNPVNFVKTAKIMTERIHAYDAKIFLQLSAGFGRVSVPAINGTMEAIGPSPIPHRWVPGLVCRELTIAEIKTYVRKFAESAAIAKKAGFDGIEIHAVHEGYLLDQFTISFFNHRTDEYGGSLMNRLRFSSEIVQAIKAECGQDFPVILRYSIKSFIKDWNKGGLPGEDFVEKGRDIEEGKEVARLLEQAGYDAFDGDVGSYDSWYWSHPPMYHKKGMYLPYNEILKQILKVPVITAGRVDDPDLASEAIATGKTDMISMARPLLADPDLPNKIRQGKIEKIRPCLSCQEGCMGRLQHFASLSCAVNPAVGREREYDLKQATVMKKVVIVGGGVAGCEAARVCALRGHKVSLYEKSSRLGGNVIPGGAPDFKEDDIKLADWYTLELKDLKVDVHLNSEVTKEMMTKQDADAVIVATGSTPKMLRIEDGDDKVFTAEDVLLGKKDPGKSTVIIGGGLVGCETALWLAQAGKKVTIVEMMDGILKVGGPLCSANDEMLKELLKFKGVDIRTQTAIVKANEQGFIVKCNDQTETIEADSAIICIGYNGQRKLYDEVKNAVGEIYLLGDARKVQNIMYAIWDAYEVARDI
ncbi:2-enoate reductase [Sporomusaceae bacterium BoRhaA]|uniref:oxidoreductase n=1 Tax=Pelorhabdus rhamnosifermentans TaxID=2772457 RepID=UPI001FEA8ED1|nr:FAD-dependent oxidoreductase [Pelorhabdus rhamnosifermentans]MBU2699987.1 2-enoate reductase [Pelorhabdus rhamnosifermentans]